MRSHLANYPNKEATDEEMLDGLQRDAFEYFLRETNPANGLVADRTQADAPASIAAVGSAVAAYPVGVDTRIEAAERTLVALRFFWNSRHGTAPDYKGFYHFKKFSERSRSIKLIKPTAAKFAFRFSKVDSDLTAFKLHSVSENNWIGHSVSENSWIGWIGSLPPVDLRNFPGYLGSHPRNVFSYFLVGNATESIAGISATKCSLLILKCSQDKTALTSHQ